MIDEKALPPCPVCKSEIDLDPHEALHVYEGDGGVIIRENGNVSTFGVQSPEVMAAFHVATAILPEGAAGLVERLRNPADRYCTQSVRDEAASLIQSQAARARALEAALAEALRLIGRYRTETPLGNQPHMIALEAETFAASARALLKKGGRG